MALLIGEGVTFVQTIALARLLTPAEIGIFAAGTVLTIFLGNFVEGGLRAALIHRSTHLEDAAETVFWVTLTGGVLMTAAAAGAATLLGQLFGSQTAGLVAAATSGVLLVHALMNVPEALLQRQFSVRRRLVVGPLVSTTFAVVAVTLAAAGWGVWSMVAGLYASQLAGLVALWVMVGWRPFHGHASWRMWRELARYGSPLVMGLLAARARQVAEAFVVGRGLSPSALGYFRYGERIARIPTNAIIEIGSNSLFPAFARIAHDRERLRMTYTAALHWGMIAASLTSGLLFALGEPAMVTLFGDEWQGAGIALTAMSGIGLGYAMTCVSEEAIKGVGRTPLLNWLTAMDLVLGIGFLVGLMVWRGFVGAALSLTVTSVVIGLLMLVLARRVVVVPIRELARTLVSPLPPMAVASAAAWVLDREVLVASSRPPLAAVACLVVATLVYAVIYVGALTVFAPVTARTIIGKASTLLSGRSARKSPRTPDLEPVHVPRSGRHRL